MASSCREFNSTVTSVRLTIVVPILELINLDSEQMVSLAPVHRWRWTAQTQSSESIKTLTSVRQFSATESTRKQVMGTSTKTRVFVVELNSPFCSNPVKIWYISADIQTLLVLASAVQLMSHRIISLCSPSLCNRSRLCYIQDAKRTFWLGDSNFYVRTNSYVCLINFPSTVTADPSRN